MALAPTTCFATDTGIRSPWWRPSAIRSTRPMRVSKPRATPGSWTGLWDVAREAIVASYFIRLRVQREVVSPHYLWAFMNTAHMKRVIFDTARGATGQSTISSKELRAFPLPVPHLSLQEQFASRCADVSGLVAQQPVATAKAKATFDALLAQAFAN